jgi:hypothetical protein
MGDVYLMDYRLVHRGTANQGQHARPILYLVYSCPWFRDIVNFTKQSALWITPGELAQVAEAHKPLFRQREAPAMEAGAAARGPISRPIRSITDSVRQPGDPAPVAHGLYGLRLASNVAIPGLQVEPGSPPADVAVHLGPWPAWLEDLLRHSERSVHHVCPWKDEKGRPGYHLWSVAGGEYYHLRYQDETEFIVDRSGSRVWGGWPAPLTLEDTTAYLLGPVFGFVLGLRGVCSLHASVVVLDGWAVAFLGSAGAGKSTTAAAFARQGHPVLSDDVAALVEGQGRFHVEPGYPNLRLWPSSVTALYGSPDALPTLTPTWEKCGLDLREPGYQFQSQSAPLAAIYILGARTAGTAAPRVEAGPGPAALLQLLGNTYASHLLPASARSREFELLGRLLRTVSVRQVIPHADPCHLNRLCEVICDDFRASAPTDGPAPQPRIRHV